MVIENILSQFSDWSGSFFRTQKGAEIDLILQKGQRKFAIECKASSAPEVSGNFHNTLEELKIKKAWVIAPVTDSYLISKGVRVCSLGSFTQEFGKI